MLLHVSAGCVTESMWEWFSSAVEHFRTHVVLCLPVVSLSPCGNGGQVQLNTSGILWFCVSAGCITQLMCEWYSSAAEHFRTHVVVCVCWCMSSCMNDVYVLLNTSGLHHMFLLNVKLGSQTFPMSIEFEAAVVR